jgi:uncharacterized protein
LTNHYNKYEVSGTGSPSGPARAGTDGDGGIIVSQLYIYPVKSLGGIAKETAEITDTGFKYDRRWMLVDENNLFLSQRTHPQMALLQTAEAEKGIKVFHKQNPQEGIIIPFENENEEKINVVIFENTCEAIEVGKEQNEWFSEMLETNCKLVYMADDTKRLVDKRYATNDEITSFTDGYPILMIGQSSLDNLNEKLEEQLPMDRFRPNLVFTGGQAYIEDEMASFEINKINFKGVKPCSRCVMTTINQQTGEKAKEPLKTLATYRMKNNKVYFGQNVLHQQTGSISIGDEVTITTQKEFLI